MKTRLLALVFLPILASCDQLQDYIGEPSKTLPVCYQGDECREFTKGYDFYDVQNECSSGTLIENESSCSTFYGIATSSGRCRYEQYGKIVTYRFYHGNSFTEELKCDLLDLTGGTSTWIED